MAIWTDGVEYAPAERPDGFATPRTAPLDQAPPTVNLAEGRPADPPVAFQPSGPAPALEAVGTPTGPTRDPKQAFVTVATAMTTSAWGSTHASSTTVEKPFDPNAPMITESALAGYAPPTGEPVAAGPVAAGPVAPGQITPGLMAPPPGMPAAPYPSGGVPMAGPVQHDAYGQPLTPIGKVLAMARYLGQTITWPLVICLVLALLIGQLSFALVVVSIALAYRVPRIGNRLRQFLGVAAPIALLLAFVWNVDNDVMLSLVTWSRIAAIASLGYAIVLAWPRQSRSHPQQIPPPNRP